MPHGDVSTPRAIHRVLLIGSVAVVVWGALAFGSVYRWAYTPLAIASAAVGLAALVVERRGRPPFGHLRAALAAILLAIGLQLVPLPLPMLMRVSPGTDAVLSQYDFSYQMLRAGQGDVAPAAADSQPRHAVSIAPEKTATGAWLFAALALLLLGLTRLISVVGARSICRSLIAFGSVLALIGIVQRGLTATELHPRIYGFWQPRFETVPFGPFVNPNHFAGWMVMGLPIALAALLDVLLQAMESAPRRGARLGFLDSPQIGALIMLVAACLVMGLSLLMTRSRSGLAAFAAGGVIVGWLIVRRQASRAVRVAVAATVVLLLLGTAAWAGLDTISSKFVEAQSGKAFESRLHAWKDTIEIVRQFPLTGAGLDTYGTAMMVFQSDNRALHFKEAHNDYLQLAAEGGLLLGVPVLLTIAVFVRDVRRRFGEAPTTGTTFCLRVGAVAGMIAIGLQSLVEFSLQMPGNAALFTVLAAIALHQSPRLPQRAFTPQPPSSAGR